MEIQLSDKLDIGFSTIKNSVCKHCGNTKEIKEQYPKFTIYEFCKCDKQQNILKAHDNKVEEFRRSQRTYLYYELLEDAKQVDTTRQIDTWMYNTSMIFFKYCGYDKDKFNDVKYISEEKIKMEGLPLTPEQYYKQLVGLYNNMIG